MNRRDFLVAGSSLSLTALAGCSEKDADVDLSDLDPRGSDIDLPGLNNDDSSENEELSKPERVEETTLPAKHTIAEWSGTLELEKSQLYHKEQIPPKHPDTEIGYGECFILECEIDATEETSINEDDDEVSLFLIPERDESEFEAAGKCPEIASQENCQSKTEFYSSSNVLGNVEKIKPGERKYVRYLLSDDSYYLIIDGADTLGVQPRTIPDISIETSIRAVKYNTMEARKAVRDEFRNSINEVAFSSTAETKSFSQDLCEPDHLIPSEESVEELAEDTDRLEEYTPFIEALINAANTHYGFSLPESFVDRLKKMVKWGSTALPVLGSIITVAEKACTLADDGLPKDERKRVSAELLLSLTGLVVEIIFIEWGVVSRVARTMIETTEKFVFGYIRKISGLRLFAYLFRSLTLHLEDGLFATITEFAERVADELIDKDDVAALAKVATGADSWSDMESLDDRDCSCENLDSGDVCLIAPSG
ncbi:hypothetical protein JMJ58_21160 (plasmid) [Haloterrigena salifodinae]|uniref:Uncharacterized protein n=1 Tax=Haloterrigena salifodinae TaxID=2675099 RepID=A0A8T8E7P8_9EURY|nr:hypothetical protein [Haloterrigena salifodinae]QRV17466.1 hypothetical protein JMJ58_21160 [Haloterrigena salifodinae]